MPANPRPEIEWTSEQVDAIDTIVNELEAKIATVDACLENLIHYTNRGTGHAELEGIRCILRDGIKKALDTSEEWRPPLAELKRQEVGS